MGLLNSRTITKEIVDEEDIMKYAARGLTFVFLGLTIVAVIQNLAFLAAVSAGMAVNGFLTWSAHDKRR